MIIPLLIYIFSKLAMLVLIAVGVLLVGMLLMVVEDAMEQ